MKMFLHIAVRIFNRTETISGVSENKTTVWRASRQACLLCRWEKHFAVNKNIFVVCCSMLTPIGSFELTKNDEVQAFRDK